MPGWGVKSECNDTSNTICRPCPLGTWSPNTPHYRPCVPCSKCGPDLFEDVTCVSTRDTKCDACSNPKARINEDFLRKCNWRQLARDVDPRELDLDDTRFDVEVLDLQSKEVGKLDDLNPEFGSSEDDFDRLLLAPPQKPEQEEDITVDDPEIDLERPESPEKWDYELSRPCGHDDVSRIVENEQKDEENEEARLMASRREAINEINQISKRLEQEKQEGVADPDDDDDDEVEPGPRRLLLQPSRPFPQMVPVPKLPTFDLEEENIVVETDPKVNNFPPSYHSYPVDSLLHAGEGQRRKAIVLLVLTCTIILSTIVFLVCYVREYCRRRSAAYNRVLVVNLSPEEREIVRQSATVLERMEQPPKKYRSGGAYTSVADAEAALCVTENPLEAYLNATDERYVAEEPLIENEVLDPRVHRRTVDA